MFRTFVGKAKRLPGWAASARNFDRVTADLARAKPRCTVLVGQNVFAQFHCSEYSTSSDDADKATSAASKGAFVRVTSQEKLGDQFLREMFPASTSMFRRDKISSSATLEFGSEQEAADAMNNYNGSYELDFELISAKQDKLIEEGFSTVNLVDSLPNHWRKPDLLADETRELYIRHFAQDLINNINSYVRGEEIGPTPLEPQIKTGAVVLDGGAGYGKTTTLHIALDVFRKAGWITMYLPSPTMFTEGGTVVRPSRVEELANVFDQPEVTIPYLKNFYSMHKEQLVQVKVKQDHLQKLGPNLLKLVEHGLRNVTESSYVLQAVRQELVLATEVPVLIAIDEIDALYLQSIYAYKHQKLWPSNLSGTRPFQMFDLMGLNPAAKPKNGFVLAATSSRYGGKAKEVSKRVNFLKHRVDVKPFSKQESFKYLSLLMKTKHIAKGVQEVERGALDQIWSVSDGCPGELLKKAALVEPVLYPDGIRRLDLDTMKLH